MFVHCSKHNSEFATSQSFCLKRQTLSVIISLLFVSPFANASKIIFNEMGFNSWDDFEEHMEAESQYGLKSWFAKNNDILTINTNVTVNSSVGKDFFFRQEDTREHAYSDPLNYHSESRFIINNGNRFHINVAKNYQSDYGFYTSPAFSFSGNNTSYVMEGKGTLSVYTEYDGGPGNTNFGVAIDVSADSWNGNNQDMIDRLEKGERPPEVYVNNLNLELSGDSGLRVYNGGKVHIKNEKTYIGYSESDELNALFAERSMHGGIKVANGGSSVDIQTNDLKIYSSGHDFPEYYNGMLVLGSQEFFAPTLVATGMHLLNGDVRDTTQALFYLGSLGSKKIDIKAKQVDLRLEQLGNSFGYGIDSSGDGYAESEILFDSEDHDNRYESHFNLSVHRKAGSSYNDDIRAISWNFKGMLEQVDPDTGQGYYSYDTTDPEMFGRSSSVVIQNYDYVNLHSHNARATLAAQEINGYRYEDGRWNASVKIRANQSISLSYEGDLTYSILSSGNSEIILEAPNISIRGNEYLAYVDKGAHIQADASNNMELKANKYIGYADNGTIDFNKDRIGSSQVEGTLFAKNAGAINLGLNNTTSTMTGAALDLSFWQDESFKDANDEAIASGSITVSGQAGSTWIVKPTPDYVDNAEVILSFDKKYSSVSKYHSEDFSFVDLTKSEKNQNLYITSLDGKGTVFNLRTTVSDDRPGSSDQREDVALIGDHVLIRSGEGQHHIYVPSSGIAPNMPTVMDQKDYLVKHYEEGKTSTKIDKETGKITQSGDLGFTLVNAGSGSQAPQVIEGVGPYKGGLVDLGLYYYRLATRDFNDQNGQGTEWYLVRANHGPENPDPETPSGDLVTDLGGNGASRAFWFAQLEDLRKRLGEVRYGAQDGLWARAITRKDSVEGTADGSFESKWYGINLGLDHLVERNEDYQWLIGANAIYGEANQKLHSKNKGEGDLDAYGMNLYATYANQHGYYADFVLTADRYNQEMRTVMTDGTPTKGSFNTWGLGASIEVGKMFSSTQDNEGWGPWYNHWWIEPQAQLAYSWFHGTDWSLDNGMRVSQDNGQSLIGRLGIVAGKQFKYGKEYEEVDKRYFQFYVKGGVKHEFLGKQTIYSNDVKFDNRLDGTSVYYGAGLDWNISDQVRIYVQVEKESGDHYDKDYEASAGLKWQF